MYIKILDHNFSFISATLPGIKECLSYTTKTFNYYNKKYKFEIVSLIDKETSTFYTGLVDYVKDTFPDTEIIDERVFPDFTFKEPNLTISLRDYQIDYLITALKKGRMIIDSVTGSGKSAMLAAILDVLNLPALIITPDVSTFGQLHTELPKLLPHRKFGSAQGKNLDLEQDQVIGLPGTLKNLSNEQLRRFKVLLIDEAHTAAANQTHDIILRTNAPYRFGFSGTPKGRSDNKDLVVEGLIGKPVKLVSRDKLEQDGYLAKTSIKLYRADWQGDFHTLEDLLIVNNPKRNELICKIVNNYKNKSILILVKRRDHGLILNKMLPSSHYVNGDSLQDEREEIREKVKNGTIKILISTKVFGTGIDIPNLEVGINARGGKSDIETVQGLGRVVRPWEEVCKEWVDIYDDYQATLESHSKERLERYKQEGIKVEFIGFPPGKERMLNDTTR